MKCCVVVSKKKVPLNVRISQEFVNRSEGEIIKKDCKGLILSIKW